MNDNVTKEDLRQFGLLLIDRISQLLNENNEKTDNLIDTEWIRSRAVRKLLDISPGTLHSLRVRGKVSYKKVLGSYYYSKEDLMALFNK